MITETRRPRTGIPDGGHRLFRCRLLGCRWKEFGIHLIIATGKERIIFSCVRCHSWFPDESAWVGIPPRRPGFVKDAR